MCSSVRSVVMLVVALGSFTPSFAQTVATASAQQPHTSSQESEALRSVDRFIELFNGGDRESLLAAFTPDATVAPYNALVDDFRRGSVGPGDYYGWMLEVDWSYELEALERVASGPFVFQRERLVYTSPDGETGAMERAALYKARDGKVQSIRELPVEANPSSVPAIERAAFPSGEGPTVFVDVAHFNHHRPELSFWPFAELLRRDGYEVRSWPFEFRGAALDSAGADVLVIANATSEKNAEEERWRLPTPSAFTPEEIAELEAWVRKGGSLLLIADHTPWPGAAAELAAAFGAELHNGAARDTARPPPEAFRRVEGTLRPHAITNGSSSAGRVDAVVTFTGHAFRRLDTPGAGELEPLLVFPESAVLFQPEVWGATEGTRRTPVPGWWQGAAGLHGRGRVALFGEAAMFRVLTEEAGLPAGAQNARLVRNTMRWLAGG